MEEETEYDGREVVSKLESFFEKRLSGQETPPKVIVVASGGTTVNMDVFGIRYLDNFSTGTRGSQIAEFFLLNDYLVVFLHRKTSNMPFLKAVQDKSDPYRLLENLTVNKDSSLTVTPGSDFKDIFLKDLENYKKCKERLLLVDFTTLNEYHNKLKVIVDFLRRFKERVAYCLVVAASDFRFAYSDIMKEKFSSKNEINLLLVPNPKVREVIRQVSDERPMLCCFKKSTNRSDMEKAAREMLDKPTGADMVVCNMFDQRLTNVTVIHSDGSSNELEATPSELNTLIAQEILNAHLKKMSSFQ